MMPNLDLEAENVELFELTTTQARAIDITSELDVGDQLDMALDLAQAKAFTDDSDISYLVIKITKD
jgi:hypothetical protein